MPELSQELGLFPSSCTTSGVPAEHARRFALIRIPSAD